MSVLERQRRKGQKLKVTLICAEFEANLGYMRPGPGVRGKLKHVSSIFSIKG